MNGKSVQASIVKDQCYLFIVMSSLFLLFEEKKYQTKYNYGFSIQL